MASGSSGIGIHGGTGGGGGGGGVQGGGGGPAMGPSFGGVQFVIQNPPLNNTYANTGPTGQSQAEAANSKSSGWRIWPWAGASGTRDTDPAVHSAQETYCGLLLYEGRGFPLFVPQPQLNLPAEWRTNGVAIGDVGRITRTGSFEFFFNIYLSATDPIHVNGVPEGFVPLSRYNLADVTPNDLGPGDYVCSSRTVTLTEFTDGGFDFSCQGPRGAVLALPHGAHLQNLENLESMRRYAAEHAESWYKYANVTRGRGLVNGRLYLITGWEKAISWGIAYFHAASNRSDFKLSFRPTAAAPNGLKYDYHWNGSCHHKQADLLLDDVNPFNQTTFIHAFAISLGERVWEKLFGNRLGICEPLDWSTFQKNSGRSLVPYRSQGSSFPWSIFTGGSAQANADRSFVLQGLSFLWSFFTGGNAYNGGRQATTSAPGDGIVTDAFPTLQSTHPSQIIHQRILREAPQARVVITHDDAWRDVFKEDGRRTTGQTPLELQQAIFERFEILEEDGAAFLRAKSDPTMWRTAAATSRPYHAPQIEVNGRPPGLDLSQAMAASSSPTGRFVGRISDYQREMAKKNVPLQTRGKR